MGGQKQTVAIIGAGPRGLTVLERIIAFKKANKTVPLDIYVFDPNPPGVGCHDLDQPDHLLLNTVSSQITMFSDGSVKGAGPILEGPSFFHWLNENKVTSSFSGKYEKK